MKLRRKRFQKGSVQLDPRTNVWSFRYRDTNGERKAERIGTRQQYRTKSSAEVAAVAIRERIFGAVKTEAVTLDRVADRYEAERMPGRHTTNRGYKGKLKIIRAKWGKYPLPLNPPEVELWLKEVRTVKGTLYSKKSREGIKSLLCILHDASMFFQYLPYTANPMELVKVPPVKGAPKKKKRIVLTKDDFRLLLAKFVGMYRVMVLLAGCVGLRRSEIFGLKWSDFNWLKNEIFIQRSTVEGYEDECKTESSNTNVPLHPELVKVLLAWRQVTPYGADNDYVFASPIMDGKKPLNSDSVERDYLRPKSIEAGLEPMGWHALRHSYRTWLAELKTGPEVQRDLMRHSTVGMTLDGYGQGVPDLNREANYAVVKGLLQ
jgi:integrase